jgi:predicted GNAT superfamily acetyltransferase
MLGFVICLSPGTTCSSLNYAWFNSKYNDFIYVDRIAVLTDYRDEEIGSKLYEKVISYSQENSMPIASEVNLGIEIIQYYIESNSYISVLCNI